MFAKLFETKLGQILVKIDANEETCNPEVRLYFEPKGLGVCSVSVNMKDDSPKSWGSADKIFSETNEESAYQTVKKVIDETMAPVDGLVIQK